MSPIEIRSQKHIKFYDLLDNCESYKLQLKCPTAENFEILAVHKRRIYTVDKY